MYITLWYFIFNRLLILLFSSLFRIQSNTVANNQIFITSLQALCFLEEQKLNISWLYCIYESKFLKSQLNVLSMLSLLLRMYYIFELNYPKKFKLRAFKIKYCFKSPILQIRTTIKYDRCTHMKIFDVKHEICNLFCK